MTSPLKNNKKVLFPSRSKMMMMVIGVASVAVPCLTLLHHIGGVSAEGSFQSGPHVGSMYAGGLDFDPTSNEILITGITYSNGGDVSDQCSCFASSFDGRYLQNGETHASRLGMGSVLEACHAISVLNANEFVVAGNSDPGGMYATADSSSGFFVSLAQTDFTVVAGASLDISGTLYPVSIIGDDINGAVFVASVASVDTRLAPDYQTIVDKYPQPNWLKYHKYGSSFKMMVHKLNYADDNASTAWTKEFPIDERSDGTRPDVYLGGMIFKSKSQLVIAGSTRGTGEAYGLADGDDEDGFVAVLNPTTGELIANGQTTDQRIGTVEDDIIAGICDDNNDSNAFYIVGATAGQLDGTTPTPEQESIPSGSLQAYVMKVQLTTLEPIWTVQWGAVEETGQALTTAVALECLVVDNVVHVAGTVAHGGSIVEGLSHGSSSGGNDLWVAQLNGEDGAVNWIHQIGTEGDERLARGSGLGLDENNNLIVFGDTTGSLYRVRESGETTTDLFLFTMNQADGSYPGVGAAQSPVAAAPTAPTEAPSLPPVPLLSGYYGLQTGPSEGPLFASGFVYDPNDDRIFMTGVTYDADVESSVNSMSEESSCLLINLWLEDGKVGGTKVYTEKVLGNPLVMETCNALTLHRFDEIVVVGNVEESTDAASQLVAPTTDTGTLYGMALALDRESLERLDGTTLLTSQPSNRFEYPISVVGDEDDLYIVSLTSTDGDFSNEFREISESGGNPPTAINWIEIQKYGTSFDMTVTKLTLTESTVDGVAVGGMSFAPVWVKEFPISLDENTGTYPRVNIGGSIIKKERGFLAIAGSTRGLGTGYGDAEGDDEDGFITLLDLESGDFPTSGRSTIREGSEKDDLVTNICDDPNDSNAFYVTGATQGSIGTSMSNGEFPDGTMNAFIRKIDVDSLEPLWTLQWSAVKANSEEPGVVHALDCAVGDGIVYVGGVVKDNAGIVHGDEIRPSYGGDDIWIAQVTSDGTIVNWLNQVGSTGDDRMAPNKGLIVSKAGHAIVYGDTNGSLFRSRSDSDLHDLIVMTFESSGAYGLPVTATETPTISPSMGEPTPTAPTAPTAMAPTPVQAQPIGLTPVDDSDMKGGSSSSSSSSGNASAKPPAGAIAGLVIGLLILAAILLWYCWRRRLLRGLRSRKGDSMTGFDLEGKAKRDGIFASTNGDSANSWSSTERGGLGGLLYSDDPILSEPKGETGYSDLANKGKEVI